MAQYVMLYYMLQVILHVCLHYVSIWHVILYVYINIRSIFKSDIRSMINFLQSNHTQIDGNSLKIISSEFWESLLSKFKNDGENVQIFILKVSIELQIFCKMFKK